MNLSLYHTFLSKVKNQNIIIITSYILYGFHQVLSKAKPKLKQQKISNCTLFSQMFLLPNTQNTKECSLQILSCVIPHKKTRAHVLISLLKF